MSATKLNQKKNQSKLSTDMVHAYLHEIGQVPLLNHYQEIVYGKQVQRMMSLLSEKQKLEQERGRSISQLEWSEVVGLSEEQLNQILRQGQQAKSKMIEANLRLVVAIAWDCDHLIVPDLLLTQNRIKLFSTYRGAVAVGDLRDLGRYIDPKSFNQAIISLAGLERLRPETLLVREHKNGGTQYTLGCLPTHPQTRQLDYTSGTFERLTQAELTKNPSSEGWGGRRTVGGSGWNTPSQISIEEAIALLD